MKNIFKPVFLVLLLVCLYRQAVQAETLQVPEDCVGKISPCLLRTQGGEFRFQQNGVEVTVVKDSILKVFFDAKNTNFELIDGRLKLLRLEPKAGFSINGHPVWANSLFVSRTADKISLLSLKDFSLAQLDLKQKESFRGSAEFLNKEDFISFTKNYFSNVLQFKSFLKTVEVRWKTEFRKQNESQTNVLRRSIASEQAAAVVRQAEAEQRALKKVRDTFFYRTFYR